MSLIKCDECGREISSKSLFCPGCGHPTHLNAGHPSRGEEPEAFTRLKESMPAPPAAEATPQATAAEKQPAAETPAAVETPEEVKENYTSAVLEEIGAEEREAARRRNERAKVWMFVLVFLALLGVVLYFYFTSPVEVTGEEAAEEAVEASAADTMQQSTAPLPADSVIVDAPDYEAGKVSGKAVVVNKPKAASAPTPEREIRVAPLSEQAAHPAHEPATTPAPVPEPADE